MLFEILTNAKDALEKINLEYRDVFQPKIFILNRFERFTFFNLQLY